MSLAGQGLEDAVRLYQAGDFAAAERVCDGILETEPNAVSAYILLAHIRRRDGDKSGALTAALAALDHAPDSIEALTAAGLAYLALGNRQAAISSFERAAALKPGQVDLQVNLAKALAEAGRAPEAKSTLQRALELAPAHAGAHLTLAGIHRAEGDLADAAMRYRRALETRPDDPVIATNLGVVLQNLGDLDEARALLEAAADRAPTVVEARKNLAMHQLLRGELADGFDGFAVRQSIRARERYPQPAWAGEPLVGRTILVWGEQGIGDEIMFASVIPDIVREAGHCVIECAARLVPIFARSFPDAEIVARTDPRQDRTRDAAIDWQCPIGELCRYRRRDRAAFDQPAAYLTADPARAEACAARYAAASPNLTIGISWRSRTPIWGQIKTAPLDLWGPILTLPNIRFIDMQYGDTSAERRAVAAQFAVEIYRDPEVDNWADLEALAAQLSALDLLVTTSNSTAHLAGALGVETMVLLPHVPDWRWQASGDTALWYPSARLYRQHRFGDWSQAIDLAAATVRARFPNRPT